MSKPQSSPADHGIAGGMATGAGIAAPIAQALPSHIQPLLSGLHRPVWIAFGVLAMLTAIMRFAWYVDYVGADNDDVMRLVQVRDLIAGQGWFDMTQYRLGLEGGTPMHWSRLIDLPIANLILFFGMFLTPMQAEAAALFVWPLLTAVPVLYAAALGARSLGGSAAALMALAGAFLFVLSINRFLPGSIDHHNVQLAVMATIAACLVVPGYRPQAFALAGLAAALAIAIGAETTPHVAVACAIVAVLWAVRGEAMRRAAAAFSLTMALALSAFFYLTVPPAGYSLVACDALSTGFYALGVVGAGCLFLTASLMSGLPLRLRLAGLGCIGLVTGVLAVVIAPECLGNPLSNLDPLLVTMWLDSVIEAQPVWAQIRAEPWTSGGFYAVPLIAMALCLVRIRQRNMAEQHAVLLALIAVSYGVGLVQVRGAVFANLLSIIPLASLVAGLRASANEQPKNLRRGLAFAGTALASVPFVWALGGALASQGYDLLAGRPVAALPGGEDAVCTDAPAMSALAREPAGVVAGPSNLGAHILRFTPHRVLSAPYHRNQGGMLTELHIAMEPPAGSLKFLRGAGVTLIAFCGTDPQVGSIVKAAPEGLYAELMSGRVPAFLEPVPGTRNAPLQLFRVRP